MIYKEDDWIAEVKILKDLSKGKLERYKLKVIKTIKKSQIYKPTKDGHVFYCSFNHDYSRGRFKFWQLISK